MTAEIIIIVVMVLFMLLEIFTRKPNDDEPQPF